MKICPGKEKKHRRIYFSNGSVMSWSFQKSSYHLPEHNSATCAQLKLCSDICTDLRYHRFYTFSEGIRQHFMGSDNRLRSCEHDWKRKGWRFDTILLNIVLLYHLESGGFAHISQYSPVRNPS